MKVLIIDEKDPERRPNECEELQAWKVEEKKSDVNLALHAYHDSITNEIEQAVFVTNDTDIAPALQMIRDHTNTRVGLVIPTINSRQPNADLIKLAHWSRTHVTADELAVSQLSRVIQSRKPTSKPESWYTDPVAFREIMVLSIPIRGSRSKVFQWMNRKNEHLNGARPIDLVDTKEGSKQVLNYVLDWIASQNG